MPTKKTIEKMCEECSGDCHNYHMQKNGGSAGAVYGIGLFGAAFYFFPQAVGLGGFIMALIKSIVWPAILVYQALSLLKL